MHELIKAKWQSLTLNEQRIAIALMGAIALLLVYTLLWAPGQQARQRLVTTLPQKQAQVALMKLQASDIAALQSAAGVAMSNPQNLKATIENSARLHKLAASTFLLEAETDGGMTLRLENVNFNAWIAWMHALQSEHHIRLARCHVEPGQFEDTVTVSATLIGAQADLPENNQQAARLP